MLTIAFKRFWRACKLPCSYNVVRHHHGFTDGVSVSFELMVFGEYLTSKSKSAMNKLYSAYREVEDLRHDQHDTVRMTSNPLVKGFALTSLQRVSHNFWRTGSEVCSEFPKFATNLAISLRTCQSNCELGNEVVNFTPNFVGKLTSSLREKFAPFGEIVSEFP